MIKGSDKVTKKRCLLWYIFIGYLIGWIIGITIFGIINILTDLIF